MYAAGFVRWHSKRAGGSSDNMQTQQSGENAGSNERADE